MYKGENRQKRLDSKKKTGQYRNNRKSLEVIIQAQRDRFAKLFKKYHKDDE